MNEIEKVTKRLSQAAFNQSLKKSGKREIDYSDLYLAIEALEKAERDRRAQDENKPLSLEQLRQMDGNPVWVIYDSDLINQAQGKPVKLKHGTVRLNHSVTPAIVGDVVVFDNNKCLAINYYYGKTWLAYARKPEQEEK